MTFLRAVLFLAVGFLLWLAFADPGSVKALVECVA